jgi:hypothetical protein
MKKVPRKWYEEAFRRLCIPGAFYVVALFEPFWGKLPLSGSMSTMEK